MERVSGLKSEYGVGFDKSEVEVRYDTPSGRPSISYELNQTQGLISAIKDAISELEQILRSVLIPVDSTETVPGKAEPPGPPVSDLYNIILEENLHLSDVVRRVQNLTNRVNL